MAAAPTLPLIGYLPLNDPLTHILEFLFEKRPRLCYGEYMKENTRRLNVSEFCPNHKGQPVAELVRLANPEHFCYLCTTGMALNTSKPQFMPTDFDISDDDLRHGPSDD